MATHECTGCLALTVQGAATVELPFVLANSTCSAPGGRHTWVRLTGGAAAGPAVSFEQFEKLVDEHIDKRLKRTPGKQDAVFILYSNGSAVGSAFAIDKHRVLTARHNLFKSNTVSDRDAELYVISPGGGKITVIIEATLEPTVDKPTLADVDDWIILRSSSPDFRTYILVTPKEGDMLQTDRPYITIYHYPIDYHTVNDVSRITIFSSKNRVSQVSDGKLYCNDLCNVSGGSCGGPYVDDSSGGAYGMHIEGVNSYSGAGYKGLSEAVALMPVALHFRPDSELITKLKELKVLC